MFIGCTEMETHRHWERESSIIKNKGQESAIFYTVYFASPSFLMRQGRWRERRRYRISEGDMGTVSSQKQRLTMMR